MNDDTLGTSDGIRAKVCALIKKTVRLPSDFTLHPEARLYGAGLGLDSFDALRLVANLEEEFNITIDDEELTPLSFESVASIVWLVRIKLEGDT